MAERIKLHFLFHGHSGASEDRNAAKGSEINSVRGRTDARKGKISV